MESYHFDSKEMSQIFNVVYQDSCYAVDPSRLCNSSSKFKEIIAPYINHNVDIKSLHLLIAYNNFSSRCINNFLQICQNLPTDVQDSELYEICEIAALFQAENIFNTSIEFIQNNIDDSFYISYNKFDDKYDQYLYIEADEPEYNQGMENLSDFEFDETYDNAQQEDEKQNQKNNNIIKSNRIPSACYQIKIENPLMKRRRFYFIKDGKVLLSAKQKDYQIFIAEGSKVHINDDRIKKSAVITRSREAYNIIKTDDQEFRIRYLRTNPNEFKKAFSMKLTFTHNDSSIFWLPKEAKEQEMLNGEYNHCPMKSRKNILLQNKAKHTTFIVRKMDKKMYEAECHSSVSPLIAFSIAISQIVGPYL